MVTSSRMGSAGVSGPEATWQRGQDEGQRPRLWHSIRTPAAMRLVPDSERLVMYSGKVSTLGSRSRSSDSSEGELPGEEGKRGVRGWAPSHQSGDGPRGEGSEAGSTQRTPCVCKGCSVGMKCSLASRAGVRMGKSTLAFCLLVPQFPQPLQQVPTRGSLLLAAGGSRGTTWLPPPAISLTADFSSPLP